MKITEDVRKYAAEQDIAEEEALKKGMEEKPREFIERQRTLRAGLTPAEVIADILITIYDLCRT